MVHTMWLRAELRLALINVKALAEALDAARRIQNALLTRIERVALRANVNLEDRLRASYGKRVATCAGNSGLYVVGMDSRLHGTPAVSTASGAETCLSNSRRVWRHAL